jgi:hypothetical protein
LRYACAAWLGVWLLPPRAVDVVLWLPLVVGVAVRGLGVVGVALWLVAVAIVFREVVAGFLGL